MPTVSAAPAEPPAPERPTEPTRPTGPAEPDEPDEPGEPAKLDEPAERLQRAVSRLLGSHRAGSAPQPEPYWAHDASERRRHRGPDRPPTWHGWVLGTAHDAGAAPTDLVLTTDGRWLRSPRVLSAHGRRFAEPLPVASPPAPWRATWQGLTVHADAGSVTAAAEALSASAARRTARTA